MDTVLKKQVVAATVKKGDTIIIEDSACRVVDVKVSKSGKHGHSKARIEGVGLVDEKKRIIVIPGQDKLEAPIIEKKTAQVLSLSGDMANIMDAESYETFDLKIPEELKGQVTEGVHVMYWIILGERVMKQVK